MPRTFANKECCICQKSFQQGKTFILTAEEKESIGERAPDEVNYCLACLKIVEDPELGPQLLTGLYEMQLREHGVNNAYELAQVFHKVLVKIQTCKSNLH